jgi:hypothetical protein
MADAGESQALRKQTAARPDLTSNRLLRALRQRDLNRLAPHRPEVDLTD